MSLYIALYTTPGHHEIRVPNTKWGVLRSPAPSMAQSAGTSLEAFEDFYFDVCCLDYEKMGEAMKTLIRMMYETKQVRIVGPGPALSFSI